MSDVATLAVLLLCTLWLVLAIRLLRNNWSTSPTRVWLVAPVALSAVGIGVVSALWATDRAREALLAAAFQGYMNQADVQVQCQPLDEYALFNEWYYGWAQDEHDGEGDENERPDVAHLNYAICRDLASYSASAEARERPSEGQLIALVVVGHEASHLAGQYDEFAAHCEGILGAHRAAQVLGATTEQAQNAQTRFVDELHGVVDRDYVSSECPV